MCVRTRAKITSSLAQQHDNVLLATGNFGVGTHNTRKTSNYNNEDYTQKRGLSALKWPNVPQYCLYVLFLETVTIVDKTIIGT